MAERRGPPNPVGPSPFAPGNIVSPDRTRQWRAREAALVDCLLKISNGNAALALSRRYWPFLWEGKNLEPVGFKAGQLEAQKNAPREAVERWLRTHGRQLQWRLELAGDWLLDSTERRILRSDVRNEIKTWGENHRKVSGWLQKLAEQPENATRRERALEILIILHGEDDHALIKRSLSDPAGAWEQYSHVAKKTKGWLKKHDANGGANLAAREVAKLIVIFFDETRVAAVRTDDAETAKRLNVLTARSSDGKEPANQYSHAVANALIAVGLPSESWRRAAEAASVRCPDADLKSDETTGGH